MNKIEVERISITQLATDAIVNAANEDLWAGGGVCGAIFHAAGHEKLERACQAIGHCDTGRAVITPGFGLKARYIIHAVGPVWMGGGYGEQEKLSGAYQSSLALALENGCHSVGFPLISAGIFGYPLREAWETAIGACRDFLTEHPEADLRIVFAVLNDEMKAMGGKAVRETAPEFAP